jgi:PIN domain nuclease of toxin-antitoxin system
MKLLLDTHILLWAAGVELLSEATRYLYGIIGND